MLKLHATAWASDSPTPAQIKEFFAQIESRKITKNRLQGFLRGGISGSECEKLLAGWQFFYEKHFNLDRDFSTLRIPEHEEGFDRLIVVAEGMTPEKIFSRIKSLMPAWKYSDNLDDITSDRKADKDYCVWVRNRVEADEELKNKSANDLKRENIPSITLEERFIYEIKFFDETGKHLDVDNSTLCTGSRHSGGSVPGVYWSGVQVGVFWSGPGGQSVDMRSRAVVS
ncbi:MAG: hypothetical protein HYT13_02285 [Candidatus Liptonbacteria bacterium]|nr:hypothetical protein [Candidatus Liptonbacteria bacterium]